VIIYVLLVWLCATLFFWVLEIVGFSWLPHPQDYLAELIQAQPELAQSVGQNLGQNPQVMHALLLFGLGICLLVTGYILEWKIKPIQNLYRFLQKIYPVWYRRWPASLREILLSAVCWGLGAGVILVLGLMGAPGLKLLYISVCWSGFMLGVMILPILHYRVVQAEDRPEKPPQALIHNLVPEFPLRHSLLIGQIYLRLLLPLFCLFTLVIPPLGLGYLHLFAQDYALLFGSLLIGLGLAWLLMRPSHLEPNAFRDNLFQLGGRLILAGGLLFFGLYSENAVVLSLFSVFAGLFAGIY